MQPQGEKDMSDKNILIEMSERLGQIHGTVSALDKKQDDFMTCVRSHESRLSELEATKHKAHGYIVGVSTISAFIGAAISNLWGQK